MTAKMDNNLNYAPLILGVEHEKQYLGRTKEVIEDLDTKVNKTIMIEAGRDWRRYDGEFFTEIGKFAISKGFKVIGGDVSKRQQLIMLRDCLRNFLEENHPGDVEKYKKKYAGKKSEELYNLVKNIPNVHPLTYAILMSAIYMAAPIRDNRFLEKALEKKPDTIIMGAAHADFLKDNIPHREYILITPEHTNMAQTRMMKGEMILKPFYGDKGMRDIMMLMGCIDFKASVDLLNLKTYDFSRI